MRPSNDFAFFPDGQRGIRLNREIGARLAESVAEILRASRGQVEYDEKALTARMAEMASAPAVLPDVFLLYYECLTAARANDGDALKRNLDALARTPVAAPPFRIRNYRDPSFSDEEADRYLRSVNPDAGAPVSFGPAPAEQYAQACEILEVTLATLDRAASDVAEEFRSYVREVVFLEGHRTGQFMFDGATSFLAWGALFLNAREHGSRVAMAEGIAHEVAHSYLFALAHGESLAENPESERFSSPLRADPRPMDGIMHAVFVTARMHYAMQKLLDAKVLNAEEIAQAIKIRDDAREAFFRGEQTVTEFGRPTEIGRAVMAAANDYMRAHAA